MPGAYNVIATFEDGAGKPLRGVDFVARVFDADPITDDALGRSPLDDSGEASFLISALAARSLDSPLERKPDLYFTLERDGREIFRSEITKDVDFEALDPVTGTAKKLTQRFGPFRVA